jgi:hypothetical protein
MGLGEIKKKTKETVSDIKKAANEPIVRTEETKKAEPGEMKTEKTTTKTTPTEHHTEKTKTKVKEEY